MKAGIVGFPKVGKTTLFNILDARSRGNLPIHPREESINIGVSEVPDQRLEKLYDIFRAKKEDSCHN